MSKTWYGHHIENIKGEDYVLFKDYLELDKEIERLNNIINELEKELEEVFNKMEEKQVEIDSRGYYYTDLIPIEDILDKLQQLKGDSSNE